MTLTFTYSDQAHLLVVAVPAFNYKPAEHVVTDNNASNSKLLTLLSRDLKESEDRSLSCKKKPNYSYDFHGRLCAKLGKKNKYGFEDP